MVRYHLAARLLGDHWPRLYLDGQDAAIREPLVQFPPALSAADAGLTAMTADDELAHGSLEAAERYLGLVEGDWPSVDRAACPRPGAQSRLLLVSSACG